MLMIGLDYTTHCVKAQVDCAPPPDLQYLPVAEPHLFPITGLLITPITGPFPVSGRRPSEYYRSPGLLKAGLRHREPVTNVTGVAIRLPTAYGRRSS